MTRHLFIVARQHPDLYSYLSREFSTEPDVRVMFDRRQGDRRRQPDRRVVPRGDRRNGDRRANGPIGAQLSSLGYAFVRIG